MQDNFAAVVKEKFNTQAHAKALTAPDLPGQDPRKKPLEGEAATGAPRKLKKSDSEASSSSSSSSDAAPLMEAATRGGQAPKKNARKAQPSTSSSKSTIGQESDAEDMEKDVPQSKADTSFLQQCMVKLNAAKQMYDHVRDLKTLKDYDDARVVTSIRALDGRVSKIVKCKFLKTKHDYSTTLCVLRAIQDLIKAVRKFESQSKLRKQAAAARAGMSTGLATFKTDAGDKVALPWCFRRHQFHLECDTLDDDPFGKLSHRKAELCKEFGVSEEAWRGMVALTASEYVEFVVLEKAEEKGWNTEQLMEKLHATAVKITECCELDNSLKWVGYMKVVANHQGGTLPELKEALDWLSKRSNSNRATLALLNAPAGEEIIKKAKVTVDNGTKDIQVLDEMKETAAGTKDALDRLDALVKGAGNDEATMAEVLADRVNFEEAIDKLEGYMQTCITTWKEPTAGIQELVKEHIQGVHDSICDTLKRDGGCIRTAALRLHTALQDEGEFKHFDDEKATPNAQDLTSLNGAHWPRALSKMLSGFSELATGVLLVPAANEIISLYCVIQVVELFVDGVMEKAVSTDKCDTEKQVRSDLRALQCFKKASKLAGECLGL